MTLGGCWNQGYCKCYINGHLIQSYLQVVSTKLDDVQLSVWPVVHLSGTETLASYVAPVGSRVALMLPSEITETS